MRKSILVAAVFVISILILLKTNAPIIDYDEAFSPEQVVEYYNYAFNTKSCEKITLVLSDEMNFRTITYPKHTVHKIIVMEPIVIDVLPFTIEQQRLEEVVVYKTDLQVYYGGLT
jgi:hypothetical protein